MTKQSETRAAVLDLIEQLAVGDSIPSERQLSVDLGVSRLTVRAALDDLVREGYLVRRRGSGTFVSEPKISQELTITSFTEDMRKRGLRPGSRTLELRVTPAGARLGRVLHVSPSDSIVVGQQTIEPTVTNEDESEALGVPLHSPAFLFERLTRSESSEIVEFVSSIYRGDRYRLVTELNHLPEPRWARPSLSDGRVG